MDHSPAPASHDLSLPAWGPYSKKYAGVAHVSDIRRGVRFDLSVFPGIYRQRVLVPHAQWESGYYPWEAAPGLSYYSYRFELEWKDRVFCDIAYFGLPGAEGSARVVRCEFTNQTDLPQHEVLHYMAYLNFPPIRPYSEEAVIPADAHLPPGALWIDALDYLDLRYASQRPSDTLVYEGWLRGEVRGHGFVNGTGIGCGFGRETGDRVSYEINLPEGLKQAVLLVRYRARQGAAVFDVHGMLEGALRLEASEDFVLAQVPLGGLAAGAQRLELIARGGAGVELDGFVLLEDGLQDQLRFSAHDWNPVPQRLDGPIENSLMLRYDDAPAVYGLAWGGKHSQVRQFFSSELDRTLRYYATEHVAKTMTSDGRGHFTNVFIRPLVLEPHSSLVLYGLVCSGGEDEVRALLDGFDPGAAELELAYHAARGAAVAFLSNPSGHAYRFSQERMAATLLTNVVYPIYTRRRFIRHFTPGKRWDCLYTWDSGFISLGLQHVDLVRGIDCLNAYTTPPGDEQAAFLHHGSPVPVQIYAFQELWNLTRSPELLRYFYPRLRQFYLFLAGRLGSSTTRALPSNLLKTWDYFYNSAGWDDYPPQVYLHANQLEARMTPVVTTAHVIRSAKILRLAAAQLAQSAPAVAADLQDYQADIDLFSQALQSAAWDEEAGVFSYVLHDKNGQPAQRLHHSGGQNYNLGLDGISPYFAGICSAEQERRILERMQSGEHMWSPVGLVSVDQAADYYREDGYWNGAVWHPYQWFVWKGLLDRGQADFAFRIAQTALELWKREVEDTYQCFEHFIVASQRGTGWHHFGGLSSPILVWFDAYHRPGTLTCGFDTWVESLSVAEGNSQLQASLAHADDGQPWTAIVVMDALWEYSFAWNGALVEPVSRFPGQYELTLSGSGQLIVTPL